MTERGDGLPVVLMAAIPLLTMQFGVEFFRFQTKRKQGVRTFRKTLVRCGMPREQAARLAQTFHEAGSVRKILHGAVRGST